MQQYASAFHFLSASINLRYTLLPLPLSLHQPQVHAPSTSSQPPSTSGTRSLISSHPLSLHQPSGTCHFHFLSALGLRQPSGTRSFHFLSALSLRKPLGTCQFHFLSVSINLRYTLLPLPLSLHQPQVHAPSISFQPSASVNPQVHAIFTSSQPS
jgi:hypothetical protein